MAARAAVVAAVGGGQLALSAVSSSNAGAVRAAGSQCGVSLPPLRSAGPRIRAVSAFVAGGVSGSRTQFAGISKATETQVTEIDATEAQAEVNEAASDFVKSAQDAWSKVDDKVGIGSLGVAALVLLWGSTGLVAAIDKLPFLPGFFEFVGLVYSGYFIYRYLLFKPDREEFFKVVDDAKGKITGQ